MAAAEALVDSKEPEESDTYKAIVDRVESKDKGMHLKASIMNEEEEQEIVYPSEKKKSDKSDKSEKSSDKSESTESSEEVDIADDDEKSVLPENTN